MDKDLKELLEDLKPIGDIVQLEISYHFEDIISTNKDESKNFPRFAEFKKLDLEEVVGWLDRVENFVKLKRLSKATTLIFLDGILGEKYCGGVLFTDYDLDFKNMLDVKRYIIRRFFDEKKLMDLAEELLHGIYKSTDINAITVEFKRKCKAIAMASLSLGIKLGLSDFVLMMSLLGALPEPIKRKYKRHVLRTKKSSLNELLKFLREEVDDRPHVQPEETDVFVVNRGISEISSAQEKTSLIKCYCCGELGHVKAKCAHNKERCSNCQRVGHLANVCRSLAVKDKNDKLQGIGIPKKTSMQVYVERDENEQRKLMDAIEFLAKTFKGTEIDNKKVKTRERYQKKREKKAVEEADKRFKDDCSTETDETSSNQIKITEDNQDDEGESQLFQINRKEVGEKLKFYRTAKFSVFINNIETEVMFASAAECCVMSEAQAEKLRIRVDPKHPGGTLRFLSGDVNAVVTEEVEISAPDTDERVRVRFYIVDFYRDSIIISVDVMLGLGYILQPHVKPRHKSTCVDRFGYQR